MADKALEFLDLTADNLFDFCDVLDAVGFEEAMSALDIGGLTDSGSDSRAIGLAVVAKLAGVVIKNASKARDSLCAFIANCTVWSDGEKVTAEEIRQLPIRKFLQLIRDFFKKDDLADFFKDVAEWLGTAQSASPSLSTTATAAEQSYT